MFPVQAGLGLAVISIFRAVNAESRGKTRVTGMALGEEQGLQGLSLGRDRLTRLSEVRRAIPARLSVPDHSPCPILILL